MSNTDPFCRILGNRPFRVIDTIYNSDLPTLKSFLQMFPDSFNVVDESGRNLLHLSILCIQYEIFDYLLALNKFDLDVCTHDGETALSLSVYDESSDYFARELIKKGADIHRLSHCGNTLLHLALKNHHFRIARLLIEEGADINAQNEDGCTPLHMIFYVRWNTGFMSEGVGLMMYYGADASIADNNGNIPFELTVRYDPYVTAVQESLFYYTFDSFSEYQMSLEVLFELVQTTSSLFFKIVSYVSEVVSTEDVSFDPLVLFSIDPKFLQVVIDKFHNVIRAIFEGPLIGWYEFRVESFENFEILLNSCLASDTIHFIRRLSIYWIVESMTQDDIAPEIITDFIFYLLSYGINVDNRDLDIVYRNYGYCDLFKTLLFMDIEMSFNNPDIIPRIIYDLEMDLEIFLSDPEHYSLEALEESLDYFARPKLKEFCSKLGVDRILTKVENSPRVPSLHEFARDAARKFIVERYNVKTSKEFYSVLKRLPISVTHERILSFETKLYE